MDSPYKTMLVDSFDMSRIESTLLERKKDLVQATSWMFNILLLGFVIVCFGILVMRKNDPQAIRPFRAPLVPFVPIAGILICSSMIISLDQVTQLSAMAWMVVGLFIYFGYSRSRSKLG